MKSARARGSGARGPASETLDLSPPLITPLVTLGRALADLRLGAYK